MTRFSRTIGGPPRWRRSSVARGAVQIWLAVWLALFAVSSFAVPPTCLPGSDTSEARFGVSVLNAASPPQSIEEAIDLPHAAFSAIGDGRLRVSAGRPLWLHVCLPAGATDHVLTILPPYIHRSVLHAVGPDGVESRTRQRFGADGESDLNFRTAAYLLSADDARATEWFVELHSTRTLTPEIRMLELSEWSRFVARDYGLFGLYLGMLLLAAMVNLLFWLHQRERINLHYACALVAVAAYSMCIGGYLPQWWPGLSASAHATLTAVSFSASGALLTLFLLDAFRMRLYYPKLYQLGRLAVGVFAALGLCALIPLDIGFDPYIIALRVSLLCTVLGSAMTLHALVRHRSVRMIAIAMLPLLAGLAASSFAHRQQALSPLVIDLLPNLGALVHLVLLNIGLARRAQRNERMRQRAQAAALRASQASERELQARIEDRTLELRSANLQLIHEIDERTATQQRLRETLESERRIAHRERQLLAMLSHELRTPLTVIDTAAQSLAISTPDAPPMFVKRIERIRRSVARLSSLAHNMLTSDRLSAPSRLHLRAHDLRATLHHRFAPSDAHRVRTEVPGSAVPVVVDPELIDIALSNLVGNALKYSPPDQPVDVRLIRAGDTATIEVSDRGPGIPEAARGQLFERYFRVDAETQPDGTGLGLYLSREIARRHGGDVWLKAPREGGGSTFCLTLPLTRGDHTA